MLKTSMRTVCIEQEIKTCMSHLKPFISVFWFCFISFIFKLLGNTKSYSGVYNPEKIFLKTNQYFLGI